MNEKYKLTVSGSSHLQRGVYKAFTSPQNVVELTVSNRDEVITQANLSADAVSFSKTLENTQNKIELVCNRLGIKESDLNYERTDLPLSEKLLYKALSLKKILFEVFIPVQWIIVYKHKDATEWQKIIPKSDIFQADSFIVFKNDKYYLFYEELAFKNYHGYLKVAELDLINNKLINDKTILNLDYHLSYPSVFEENGRFYMIPESADNNTVDLFECTDFPYQWQKKKTLINNIKAVDTTPLKVDKHWYLFTTEILNGAGCNDELSIYKSPDLFNSPFEKLYEEPVISDVTNARMAGHFIKKDGELFRVSQNCGKRYGHQANLNKIFQVENGYKEKLVKTIEPENGALGLHTYNQAGDIIVADIEIMRFDWQSLKRVIGGKLHKIRAKLLPF